MDGITNIAKQQQSQTSQQEAQGAIVAQISQVEKPRQVDIVEDIQKESSSVRKIDSKEEVQDLVNQLNKALAPMTTNVKFGVDKQDVFYVSVIEAETSKVIRRFPAEEAVGFLPKMKEVSGILFDTKG
ncbi:flagellar protein FlaG [Sulfurimonas sp.]|jgi:flagellar protein FlaG|uniref:flagellar protein FlaG n=1 Tax=Sulfurimonas sp. TaxID=2022749 RepID=UPI0025E12F1C|nr:flagellar protein FlaG [Sulfurimonas sp.]MCK9473709.1 flagellar protein FlaG [Sulfurimonas sp.]